MQTETPIALLCGISCRYKLLKLVIKHSSINYAAQTLLVRRAFAYGYFMAIK